MYIDDETFFYSSVWNVDSVEVIDEHGDPSSLGLIESGTYYDTKVMLAAPMD